MDLQAYRQSLLHQLSQVESRTILEAIGEQLERLTNPKGQSISHKQYNQEIQEAENRIAQGKVITHEDLLKQMDKW